MSKSINKAINLDIYYHPKQYNIFYGADSRYKIIAKGRRFGLTKGMANYSIEQLLDGVKSILWVDTIYSNIDRYLERYFLPVINKLPTYIWSWKQQKKELKINNSYIDFRSADRPENIEGFGYELILLNEAGIILKNEYLYYNTIQPMLLDYKHSRLIAGGTPKGKGLFYELYIKGLESDNWQSFRYTTYDNPFLSKKDIDEIIANMPELVIKQEIQAEFIKDTASVFSDVYKCMDKTMELRLPKPGEVLYGGLDLGKYQDFTVLTFINKSGEVIFMDRIKNRDWNYQKSWIKDKYLRYNKAKILIDSTGVGDAIYDDLREDGINIDRFLFTNASKKNLIEGLVIAVDNGDIKYPKIDYLINEMLVYEYSYKATGIYFSAPEGYHDDAITSLALALYNRNNAPAIIRVKGGN